MVLVENKKVKRKKKVKPLVEVVADLGTSEMKILYSIDRGKAQWMLMGSQYHCLPVSSVDDMSTSGFGQPEKNAWVRLNEDDNCHLVGFLAKTNLAFTSIKKLKRNTLKFKILAIIGAIVKKEKLGNSIDLRLSILLPLDEYKLPDEYKDDLKIKLSSFYFQDKLIKVKAKMIDTCPEGFGLVLYKVRVDNFFQDKKILFIMQGYRNTTCLTFNEGVIDKTQSSSSELGFYILMEGLLKNHPELKKDQIYEAIDVKYHDLKRDAINSIDEFCYTERGAEIDFKSLSKSSQGLEELTLSYKNAKENYCNLMQNWLEDKIQNIKSFDEIVLSGGTSDFMYDFLEKYFKSSSRFINISYSKSYDELKKYLLWNKAPGLIKFLKGNYALRFSDAWGLFVKFTNYDLKKILDPKTGNVKTDL